MRRVGARRFGSEGPVSRAGSRRQPRHFLRIQRTMVKGPSLVGVQSESCGYQPCIVKWCSIG